MAVGNRHSVDLSGYHESRVLYPAIPKRSKDFPGFRFDFLFFAFNERNYVIDDVQGRNTRVACTG
jgi:hypothetical protein